MEKETELFIKDLTKKIINKYNIKYPINTKKLIKKMGGNTKNGMMLKIEKNDNGLTIFSDGTNYQNALMIGNLFIFMGFGTPAWNSLENKDYFYKNKAFYILKEFALNLLMPDDLFFKELYKVFDDSKKASAEDIAKIGKKFKVSPTLIFSKAKDYIY